MGKYRPYLLSPIKGSTNERFCDFQAKNVVPRELYEQNNFYQNNNFKLKKNTLAAVRERRHRTFNQSTKHSKRQRSRSRSPNVYIRWQKSQHCTHSDKDEEEWKTTVHNDDSHEGKINRRMCLTGKDISHTIDIKNQVPATERFSHKKISSLPKTPLTPSYPWLLSFGPSWYGTINMLDIQTCRVIVEPIRGYHFQFSHLMESDLHIVGGIRRSAFWQCMDNIKTRGRKTVSVSLIKPASIFDVPAYKSYFNYFYTRRLLAHISYRTANMSFFLLLPLPAGKRIKHILRSFQNDPTTLVEGITQTDVILAIMILIPSPDIQTIQVHRISQSIEGEAVASSLMPKRAETIFPPLPKESPPRKPTEPDDPVA